MQKENWMKNKSQTFASTFMHGALLMMAIILLFFSDIYAQKAALVDLDSTHQRIRGFGAANILPWRPDMTESEIRTAFGTEEGQLGLSILRLMIEPTRNNWSLNVRTAQKAHDMGVLIFASPWNAPSDMLETVNGLKRVRHDRYEEYARHLDDFRVFMENNGVPIYAISVQNEPDWNGGWTQWTAGEMLTFMKEYASVIGTRVMAPESFQFRHAMSDPMLNDPVACANLDIVGGHIYGAGLAPYPLAKSKGKEIWMTEHYTESQNSGNLWPMALDVGMEMNDVMYAGMNAYIWWYIVRFYGPISDGTKDSGRKGDVTKRGHVMSQFSRFIRPGYFRIQCDRHPQSFIYTSAYRDSTSSKVVIVAINTSLEAKTQTFTLQDGHVDRFTPFVTSETKNCAQEEDIIVANRSLAVTLDAKSITTLLSRGNVKINVENAPSSVPASSRLLQNYPNPFNPSTRITFEIAEKSFVSLRVYNILGEEMQELAGKEYAAGLHSVLFDASRLPNGIYLYTLHAGDFLSTRKMIFAK